MSILALLGTVLLASAAPREAKAAARLAVIGQAPAFTLIDQDRKKVSRDDFKGKVWLVSFVFTTCTGNCPETTLRMSLVQEQLKKRGLLGSGQVRLLSITLDPARDTPGVLRSYARTYDADPAVWSFLTGTQAEVGRAIAAWGMWARPTASGQLDHPSRIFLVDRRGRIREIYNLAFLRPVWVAQDVQLLLKEAPK
jgi:protein SCO1/2